jgi:hypothetical protein
MQALCMTARVPDNYFGGEFKAELITPRETVYSVMDIEIQQKLGLTAFTE